MLHKTCTLCKETKELSEFYIVNSKTKPDKLTARCKKCTVKFTSEKHKTPTGRVKNREAVKRWQESNKEKRKNYELFREYGITLDTYKKLLDEQNHKCAICKKDTANSKRKGLYVDHCHTSTKVRGLLCQKCNQGLGLFDDNVEYLEQAVSYLKRSRENESICEDQSRHYVGTDEQDQRLERQVSGQSL